ncbi:MAG: hypothetical protein GY802_26840, partial [Gammaproteobacteria bacterium]|nr:hypothetical protein [Gammaproteobacteria bacterium]
LGTQLSDFVMTYAPKFKIDIVQDEGPLPLEGRSVVLEIRNITSWGNAFIGHRKSATVSVELLVDGKTDAFTTKSRESGGGMWGGFKSSCDVFTRVVKTLGKDIGKWLSTLQ